MLQLLKPACLEPMLCNKRSPKPACSNEDPMQPKIINLKKNYKKKRMEGTEERINELEHTTITLSNLNNREKIK